MSVNLRRFVDLNVSRTKRNVANPVRDTVALYGADANFDAGIASNTVFTSGAMQYDKQGNPKNYVLSGYDFISKQPVANVVIQSESFATSKFYPYAKTFFDNGGAKLHVYFGVASVVGNQLVVTDANDQSLTIPNEEIAIACLDDSASTLATLDALATSYNNALNPNALGSSDINLHTSANKEFIAHVDVSNASSANENVGMKYGKPGIEMSVLAYLSKLNVYGENTVNDYNFTVEKVIEDGDSINGTTYNLSGNAEVDDNVIDLGNSGTISGNAIVEDVTVVNDDALIGECMQNFINVDTYIAKAVRNVGGDLATGEDLTNYYATIILQQTVEEVVVNALSDKLAGAEGTAVIYNTVVAELNKYVRCGLLSAGNWENVDWVVEYNDETYVVANANERITLGYKLLVIPFAAMTQQQVSAHMCPPIYIALMNKYGIRKVFINGEVR